MAKWIALGAVAALVLICIFFPVVAWILLGLVMLIICLTLFVPIGVDVEYIGKKFSLDARWGSFTLHLFPRKPKDTDKPPKEEKPKKEKKPKEPSGEKKEKKPKTKIKLRFTREEYFELVKRALKGLGKFGKIRVRKFMLHYVAAGEDPYNTAKLFNFVNGCLSTLAPICNRIFSISDDVDVWTAVDYQATDMVIDTEVSVTLRLIQLVRAGVAAAFGVIVVVIKNKCRLRKEAKLAAKNAKLAAKNAKLAAKNEASPDDDIEISVPDDYVDVTVGMNYDSIAFTVKAAEGTTDVSIGATEDAIKVKVDNSEDSIDIPIIDLDKFVDEENDWKMK